MNKGQERGDVRCKEEEEEEEEEEEGRGLVHVAVEEEGEEGGDVFALYRRLLQAGAAESYSEGVQHGSAGLEC